MSLFEDMEPQPPHIKCPLTGKMCECLKEEIKECIEIKNKN